MLTIVCNDRPAGRVAICALLCLFMAVLSAGSAQARSTVKGTWQEGATRNQAFTRVLVVGVSPNVNQRCAFEFFMASQLQSESVQVIRSCDAVKQKNPLTLESIEQAVVAASADAVLATKLVAREVTAKDGGSRDTRGTAAYKATDSGYATGYYGVYGVPVIYGEFETLPSFTIAQGKAEVSSSFYRTSDKTLLYTLDTTATKLESSDAALHDFAAAIADKLRREGLTR